MKETFLKRHKVERTNKTEIRLEEQSVKMESGRENLWNEISFKKAVDRNRYKNRRKGVGKLS